MPGSLFSKPKSDGFLDVGWGVARHDSGLCGARGRLEGNLDLGRFLSLSCAAHMAGRAASNDFDPRGYLRY